MAKKMPRQLVALSATAIASIYLAGFMSTHGAADSFAADAPATTTIAVATGTTAAPTVVVGATAAPTASATSAAASSSGYVDGTYSGTGTSRFGNVYVSVTISGGAISAVQITRVSTSFPMSRIASLPGLVVLKQTANVNAVSGATYSSQAFKQAVSQALGAAAAK